MGNDQLIEAAIIIAFILFLIAIPYFCCQVSDDDYHKIAKGIQQIKI